MLGAPQKNSEGMSLGFTDVFSSCHTRNANHLELLCAWGVGRIWCVWNCRFQAVLLISAECKETSETYSSKFYRDKEFGILDLETIEMHAVEFGGGQPYKCKNHREHQKIAQDRPINSQILRD